MQEKNTSGQGHRVNPGLNQTLFNASTGSPIPYWLIYR